jgi:flagellar basal-body rod protein FlgF
VIRGLYIAASGMLAESDRQDVIANNLANVTTSGFRRSEMTSQPFAAMLVSNMGVPGTPQVGNLPMGVEITGTHRIEAQGPLRSTGNPLDVALVGTGYLTVQAPGGAKAYTRAGDLQVSGKGQLATSTGSVVLGENGPITVKDGPVTISSDGRVSQGGAEIGRLRIVDLKPGSLTAQGDTLVTGTEAGPAKGTQVRQGYLEGSSVNTVTEMVKLIEVMRSFEANQKAVSAQDETLEQAVTKVGVVG